MPSQKRINQITDRLFSDNNRPVDYALDYGEPGYSLAENQRGILLSDWNDFTRRECKFLEKLGFELEWSDEWTIDYENNCKAYRTVGNGYEWESSIAYTDDGEILTPDDDISAWVDEFSMTDYNQPIKCLPSRFAESELQEQGFILFANRQETGWHSGQTDNPEDAAHRAFKFGNANRVIFRKVENSQFYCVWQCWIEPSDDSEE